MPRELAKRHEIRSKCLRRANASQHRKSLQPLQSLQRPKHW
jgi:hypothetical protein